jgi:hypothetical protein
MSFSASPLEWGDGMKCNPGRLFRCNPRTYVALKFSQIGCWGVDSNRNQLAKNVTGQVRLHCFPQTTVQNFLDSGI